MLNSAPGSGNVVPVTVGIGRHRSVAAFALAFTAPVAVLAAEPKQGPPTKEEIEAWLDARAMPGARDVEAVETPPEAPPPPPPHRGLVVESSIGALGHVGDLKDVSPPGARVGALVGYEIFDWVMILVTADVAFHNTSFGSRPPEPRGYALYGGAGGCASRCDPPRTSASSCRAPSVPRAPAKMCSQRTVPRGTSHEPYFGASLGLEWYQVNPHLALALQGGVRNYREGLTRQRASSGALAWHSALALRYAFNLR